MDFYNDFLFFFLGLICLNVALIEPFQKCKVVIAEIHKW